MTQLELSLDYVCLDCEGAVGVTVQCCGRGLEEGEGAVTAVRVPCPNCGSVSRVAFRPVTGEIVELLPLETLFRIPLPSLN
jgi:hypothetical protein